MLRIRLLSGLEAACIPQEELSDVKALKQHLNRLHGFPIRFRQKLFRCGSLNALDDASKLDCETELELVLLTHAAASRAEADILVTAAENGSKAEARLSQASRTTLLQANPHSPNKPQAKEPCRLRPCCSILGTQTWPMQTAELH